MKQRDYKEELIAFFTGSALREYKEQAERENIRMLNVLSLTSVIFSLVIGLYTNAKHAEFGWLGNVYLYLCLLSFVLRVLTKRVAERRPALVPWIVAGCYLVWTAVIAVQNAFFLSEIELATYYALIGLGCCFLISPVYLLLLQVGAAVLISVCIFIYKPLEEAWSEVSYAFVLMVISVSVSLVALWFRVNSLKKTEEREQIIKVTALYQSIIDETQTGVYVRELGSYKLLYLNRKAREIFGIGNNEDIVGQRCYRLFYHQDVACGQCPARQRNKDGMHSREVLLGGHYYATKGKIIDWCGRAAYVEYLTDITDAKKVSEQMRMAHDNLQKKYEEEVLYRAKAVSDDMLSTSRVNLTEGIVEEMRVGKMDGYEDQYRHVMDFSERISSFCNEIWLTEEQNRNLSREGLLELFEQGEITVSVEYIVALKSGRHAWIRVEVKLLRRPETSEVMAFIYNRNITRERLLGHVLERIMSFEYDEIYTVDATNRTFEGIGIGQYALDEEHMQGSYDEKLASLKERAILPEDLEKLEQELSIESMHERLKRERTHLFEVTLVAKSGKARRKCIRYMYLYEAVDIVLVTITDIDDVAKAERKKQEQLESALLLAREASHAKGSFLASMSHEIRTPMNAIIGLNSIIKDEIDNREQVLDCSEKLDSASKYLLALLNDILDMSQIESGNMTLAHQTFSSDKFWDNINILAKAQADMASVSYLFERDKEASGMYIGDATRLQQIMINLINNAIKFTAANGHVRVAVREWITSEGRAELRVSVEDNGIGISEEFLPEVFGTFTQQHAGNTTAYKGSGLGLSIARNFARMMDGDITVESKEGVGTIFTVIVVLDIDETGTAPEEQEEVAVEQDFTGRHILLVEDHPLNIIVAKSLLAKRGFEVVHAENGEEAVRFFSESEEGTFDAILMDIRMPVMDGIEATMRIREMERADAKSIPIIAMTANAYEEDRRRTSNAGMNAHLAKPIDPKQLFKTLDDFIRQE